MESKQKRIKKQEYRWENRKTGMGIGKQEIRNRKNRDENRNWMNSETREAIKKIILKQEYKQENGNIGMGIGKQGNKHRKMGIKKKKRNTKMMKQRMKNSQVKKIIIGIGTLKDEQENRDENRKTGK